MGGANPDFAEANSGTTQKLAESLAEAVQWIHDPANVNERYEIISNWTKIPVDVVKKMGLQTQYLEYPKMGL